jgi:hypothetical protein
MPFIFDTLPIKRLKTDSLVERLLAKAATLDDSEKEEREDKRLIQKDTKFKPPRQDLRRRDVEDRDTRGDDDSDAKQDKKDKSQNYKDASIIRRVASRYIIANEKSLIKKFLKDYGDKTYKSPTTGNEVKLRTLNSGEDKDRALFQREFNKWKKKQEKSEAAAKGKSKVEPEATPEPEAPAKPAPKSKGRGKGKAEAPVEPEVSAEPTSKPKGRGKAKAEAPVDPEAPAEPTSKSKGKGKAKAETPAEPEAPAESEFESEYEKSEKNQKAFSEFAKSFSSNWNHQSLLNDIPYDKRNEFLQKVNQTFESKKEILGSSDSNKLAQTFSDASKTLSDESDKDNPDLNKVVEAFAILNLQKHLLKGKGEKEIANDIKDTFKDNNFLDAEEYRDVEGVVDDLPLYSQNIFNKELKSQLDSALQNANDSISDKKKAASFDKDIAKAKAFFSDEAVNKRKSTSPVEAAKHAAILMANNKINDPMVRFSIPEDNNLDTGSPKEQATKNDRVANSTYQNLIKNNSSAESAGEIAEKLYKQSQTLPEGSIAYNRAIAAYNAVRVYQISRTKPNEEIEGVVPAVANAIRAAARSGLEREFFETAGDTDLSETQRFQRFTDKAAVAFKNLSNAELAQFLPDDDPLKKSAQEIFSQVTNPYAQTFIRDQINNVLVGGLRFFELEDSEYKSEIEQARTELHENTKSITSEKNWFSKPNLMQSIKDKISGFFKLIGSFFSKWKNSTKETKGETRGFFTPRPSSKKVARLYAQNIGNSFITTRY